jgi:carbonic anhydrase
LVTDAFRSVEASVREDMAKLKADPFLPKHLEVVGYVYNTFSGRITEVL